MQSSICFAVLAWPSRTVVAGSGASMAYAMPFAVLLLATTARASLASFGATRMLVCSRLIAV